MLIYLFYNICHINYLRLIVVIADNTLCYTYNVFLFQWIPVFWNILILDSVVSIFSVYICNMMYTYWLVTFEGNNFCYKLFPCFFLLIFKQFEIFFFQFLTSPKFNFIWLLVFFWLLGLFCCCFDTDLLIRWITLIVFQFLEGF